MNKTVEHFQNRINRLNYRDTVSNGKKQVSNMNLIRKVKRQMNAAKG